MRLQSHESVKKLATLNSDQSAALKSLQGIENVFLTGAAGTGKSYLLKEFLKGKSSEQYPVLASTAAAAILLGGRTFHSFFGIGIMEGGYQATLERALKNRKLKKRLKDSYVVVIDEVSMLSGTHIKIAEEISRKHRGKENPWGGLRVVAVGDFSQLPPVNPYSKSREWAFLDYTWQKSGFNVHDLKQVMRSKDQGFLEVLSQVRRGEMTEEVRRFLDSRVMDPGPDFEGTRLFSRRMDVESYNLGKLSEIDEREYVFETEFSGKESDIEKFKKNVPIPEVLRLKCGALVMFRQNDNDGKWVNGTQGILCGVNDDTLMVELIENGRDERRVEVPRTDFTMLDGDGMPVAKANNFPIQLAWGITIHKAQGTTIDHACMDLRNLWEPGQAYVALSRVRSPKKLVLTGWDQKSIFADPEVIKFYNFVQR